MRKLSLLLFLFACGDDSARHTPDATVHDAAHDGAPDSPADAAPGAVTLTITSNGSAATGIAVYFQNADNSVVLATTTDANGAASAVMGPGGYVTAVQPFLGLAGTIPTDTLDTFIGVKPGDQLHIDKPLQTGFQITFTGARSTNNAVTDYGVFSPCLDTGQGGTVNIGSAAAAPLTLFNCGTTTDFVEIAYDDSGTPVEYLRATNVAVSSGGTVDLTGQTFAATTTKSFTYANVPNTWGIPTITDSLASISGRQYVDQFSGSLTAATTRALPAFGGAIDITASQMYDGMSGMEVFVDWGAFATTYTLDVGARALPDFTGGPSYAAATHQITVPEAAGGVTPDFTRIAITANRSQTKYWNWTVVSPHATTITLPTLPTTIYDYNLASTDSFNMTAMIGQVPGGYDAVRGHLATFASILQFIHTLTGSITVESTVLTFSGKPAVLAHRTR
jgi:hypothetical protein